jgi:hypothetical protein
MLQNQNHSGRSARSGSEILFENQFTIFICAMQYSVLQRTTVSAKHFSGNSPSLVLRSATGMTEMAIGTPRATGGGDSRTPL